MSGWNWLGLAAVAAIFGICGQLARFVLGLSSQPKTATRAAFIQSLTLALIVGGVAGIVAALANEVDPDNVTRTAVVSFVAAGYIGTDAVEQYTGPLTGRANGKQIPSGS
jgi:hypothetical protein